VLGLTIGSCDGTFSNCSRMLAIDPGGKLLKWIGHHGGQNGELPDPNLMNPLISGRLEKA